MSNIIYLNKNEVYFHATFHDRELTIPCIGTYIYAGFDKKFGHLFKDASDSKTQICFEEAKISDIYDKHALSLWLLEDHSPLHSKITECEYQAQ